MQYFLDYILAEGYTTDACQKFIDVMERTLPAFNNDMDLALDDQGEHTMEAMLEQPCIYAYLCDVIDIKTKERFHTVQWAEHDQDLHYNMRQSGFAMMHYLCICDEPDWLD